MLLSGALEGLLVVLLFKIKRFHNGMPFLYSSKVANIGTFICLFCMTILTYMQINSHPKLWFSVAIPFLFTIAIILLIYWWKNQLTKYYLNKIRTLELESLRNELREKTELLAKLEKDNREMSGLIHKDNKLIPAMENAVYEYLTSDSSINTEKASRGYSLLDELHRLSENRKQILSTFSISSSQNYITGISSLDTLLSYMNKKAQLADINFTANIPANVALFLPTVISPDDIVHLLADLIENAIIATANCSKRRIQLQLYIYDKCLIIELYDTGIPFDLSALMNFGIETYTTHAESGGQGIGLMDIWNIKKNYNASIHITEYEKDSAFCKKIAFILDKKNQYLIYSRRYADMLPLLQRTDLHIIYNNYTDSPEYTSMD